LGKEVHFVDGHPVSQSPGDGEDPQRRWMLEFITQVADRIGIRIQPVHADVQHAQRLLNHFGEAAADRHDLTDALHLASDTG
jgi:hypothetical protein